jgi:hypothetical protein
MIKVSDKVATTEAGTNKLLFEEISDDGVVYAMIIRSRYSQDGIKFFTPPNFSQQLGYMNRKKGYTIPAHVHKKINRKVKSTSEVLFVKSGKLLVDFYNLQKECVKSTVLCEGDVILLSEGGHGFRMLEDTELIEVKQGPYAGDQDKERFDCE